MKFGYLLASFNIVLFLCFLTVFLLPAFILDFTFMEEFWSKSWYIGILFLMLILFVNLLYARNRILLQKLEQEDWPGLAQYLETELFTRQKISARKVNLLTDSLLLLHDLETVKKLEVLVADKKHSIYNACATGFASAALVSADHAFLESVVQHAASARPEERIWLELLSGISSHSVKQYDKAGTYLLPLAQSSSDPVVAALSGYICEKMLAPKLGDAGGRFIAAGAAVKQRIIPKLSRSKWLRLVEEAKSSMHVVILSRLLEDAGSWLFDAAHSVRT